MGESEQYGSYRWAWLIFLYKVKEQETVFVTYKKTNMSQENIGRDYELKTAEVFNLRKNRALRRW